MSHSVQIGNVIIGGGQPLCIQSMCNTNTLHVEESVAQCVAMAAAGSTLIRLTTQGLPEVRALAEIKRQLRARGITNPLVADVHFAANVAMEAAKVAEKVRINPGNFAKDPETTKALLLDLIGICKEHHTALRIGVNHGSLSPRIIEQYGDTPQGMCEGAMEYLRICQEAHFDQVVVSMKSSNTRVMTAAYRLVVKAMKAEGMDFPIHLGITEAGNGLQGRLKSAAGLATLLQEGIGDTLRVSLTEDPVNEVIFGRKLVTYFEHPCPDQPATDWDDLIIKSCFRWAPGLLNQTLDYKTLPMPFVSAPFASEAALKDFCLDLLQATRCLFSKPEYISCPGCGRTKYNLEETVAAVKAATSHLKGCTIAIMGCIVNGPGEMADADFGYVGEGGGKVTLYKGKTPVLRGIPQEEAVQKLLEIITDAK